MSDSLQTIADFVRYAYSRMNNEPVYFGHGTDNSWDEAVHLVLQSLHLPWNFDQPLWGCRVCDDERLRLYSNIRKRIDQRIPTAYITQTAWFCGLKFYVDERVLVPRSPIAELIQSEFQPWVQQPPKAILDLCTGSGCIGIACATAFPDAEVDVLDISSEALDVASININAYGLDDSVVPIQSDVYSALGEGFKGRYDLIVSNPPYVDEADLASMPDEFHQEPVLGLTSGKDGLDLVRRMLKESADYLKEDGILIVELGNSWEALELAFPDFGFTWLEFEQGGHGVFVITAEELRNGAW